MIYEKKQKNILLYEDSMADFVHEGVEMVQNASTEYGRRLKHTRFKKNVAKKKISCKNLIPNLFMQYQFLSWHPIVCFIYIHKDTVKLVLT